MVVVEMNILYKLDGEIVINHILKGENTLLVILLSLNHLT